MTAGHHAQRSTVCLVPVCLTYWPRKCVVRLSFYDDIKFIITKFEVDTFIHLFNSRRAMVIPRMRAKNQLVQSEHRRTARAIHTFPAKPRI